MTRVFRCIAVTTALAGLFRPTAPTTAQTPPLDAGQVLAATRQALGGEKNLAAVKTFIATGRTRQIRGNNLVPIEFEMSCELPDRFVRKDEIPAQDTDPSTLGFNGDYLIQFPPSPPGRGRANGPNTPSPAGRGTEAPASSGRSGASANPAQQRVVTVKQDFVRLTLGMFATSFSGYPVSFKYAAQGEAPEGVADILDVSGPANFSGKLIVQRATHLPVMLMWQLPASNAKPVEYRLYYGDFREVDGLKWPFRLRRAIAGETVEETTFDRFRINAKIDPKKFEVPKS
jgi:hypothetical protein